MLNDDKTEFIVIASRHLLKKAAVNTIRVGDCDVSKVSVVRILGAWFDDQLTMAVHITKICSAAFYHLHNVRRIRKYLSVDAAATLIHSFISSRIDYCNSLLYGVLSAILTSCREFKTQPPGFSLCRANFTILPRAPSAELASCLISY